MDAMSETTSLSSGEKIVTTSTMMDDPELLGAHPAFPSTYRPFLDELCEKTKFSKAEIRFLYRGFKQVSHQITCIFYPMLSYLHSQHIFHSSYSDVN